MSRNNPTTREALESLPKVRVLSWAGPCLERHLIRRNGKSFTVGHWSCNVPGHGHLITEYVYTIHTEPCHFCEDHPQTSYPNGYEG